MVTLQFHLDIDEAADAFWWVSSPDVPSLYATSTQLTECQQIAIGELDRAAVDVSNVRFVLADYGIGFS